MNDNRSISELLRDLNIGANGRWFVLALVAVAIAAGYLRLAVFLAMILGVAVIAEQVAEPYRSIASYVVYAWAAIVAVVLLFIA